MHQLGETFWPSLGHVKEVIKEDWQLQGCIIAFIVLIILIVLINIEWKRHGSSIMNLETSNDKPSSVSSRNNSFSNLPQFPDEDPLTFIKKKS